MKKTYQQIAMELILVAGEDVLTASATEPKPLGTPHDDVVEDIF